ncbi:MAG: metalloregulator ArsR/SmtB family transcription factor [Terracidiphilus sp.]|nr:metalloregulator ArsR/SmtB family transcription factor [Terracidiphilus sp.]
MAAKVKFDRASLFLALANETRLELLRLIGDREVCVCELVEALRQPQPKISQHLACLRSVGVVQARREGKWMHYRIVPPPHPGAERILRATLAWLSEDKPKTSIRSKSTLACCAPSAPPSHAK